MHDPDVGRWTAKDPLWFEGGDVDLYGYCLNNPVNFVDPDGHKVFGGARPGIPRYVPDILDDIEKLRSSNDADTGMLYKFRLPGPSHPWQFQRAIALPCDTVIPVHYGPGGSPEASDNPGPTDPGILWDESFLDESLDGLGDSDTIPHGALMTISNVVVSNISTDAATIRWTTNQAADSLVQYGPTTSYGSSEYDPSFTKNHRMHLTNLSWGTTYHFSVVSTHWRFSRCIRGPLSHPERHTCNQSQYHISCRWHIYTQTGCPGPGYAHQCIRSCHQCHRQWNRGRCV